MIGSKSSSATSVLLYVSILVILGIISILGLGFAVLMSTSSYGKQGPPGIGIQGPPGTCELNNTNQTFIAGNLTIGENLILNTNTTIRFPNSTITSNETCLDIESTIPICLNVPYIESATDTVIFNDITLCFDVNCTSGIGPGTNSGTTIIYGNLSFPITLPFLIGDNGGYLDQLPGANGGFLISSNPNSTGGIKLDSRGSGIYGNETFNEFITFLNVVTGNGGFRIYNGSNYMIFSLFYNPTNYLGLTANTTEPFLIQSNQSLLVLKVINNSINVTATRLNLNIEQIFIDPLAYLYNSNLSFDINSNSTQIGFYNNSLIGWIRSNETCPISIGSLLCTLDIQTYRETIKSLLTFESGASIYSNSTLNITAPTVFIDNLLTDTFTVLGFTVFPAGISTSVIMSTGSGTNNFAGPISAPIIQATTQLSSLGTFGVTGLSTFNGPTFLNSNVTFNGQLVQCITPLFQAGVPNACLPDCIDFYNCSMLRSIGYYGRNFIRVAEFEENITNTSLTFVTFGNPFNFIYTNVSYLSTFRSNSKNSTIKTVDFSEYTSLDYNNLIGMNRTTIFTMKSYGSPGFSTPSCLPLITITINSTGTPTPVTLDPPFYNYSDSTCTSMSETFQMSNHSVSGNDIFIGSALINRTCSGSSSSLCTPFITIDTKTFSFSDLLLQKTLINSNTRLSQDAIDSLSLLIADLVDLNLTMQSIVNLFLINVSAIQTVLDTYTLNSYAYANVNGSSGEVNISGSSGVNLGEDALNVNSVTKNIVVFGDILAPDGNEHPCCGSSTPSVLGKYRRATLTSPLLITGLVGSSATSDLDFSSASVVGNMTTLTQSTSTFTAAKNGIYHFSANFQIQSPQNVTDVGCNYFVQGTSYRFGSLFTTITTLPSPDGTSYYLECNEMSIYLPLGDTVKFQIFTQNALTTVQPSDFSITINTGSFIQVTST